MSDAYLEHYGVKGMRWGKRKAVDPAREKGIANIKSGRAADGRALSTSQKVRGAGGFTKTVARQDMISNEKIRAAAGSKGAAVRKEIGKGAVAALGVGVLNLGINVIAGQNSAVAQGSNLVLGMLQLGIVANTAGNAMAVGLATRERDNE